MISYFAVNLLLILFLFGTFSTNPFKEALSKPDNQKCQTETKNFFVRGSSLKGLIDEEDKVQIILGFYNCNEIKRNEVVAYDFKGNPNLIIKIVKGIPGDNFQLKEDGGQWKIIINSEVVTNSNNQPYLLNRKGYEMLSLYEKNYNNKIPPETYMILGNISTGSTDSTKFGLVSKKDILGKVVF